MKAIESAAGSSKFLENIRGVSGSIMEMFQKDLLQPAIASQALIRGEKSSNTPNNIFFAMQEGETKETSAFLRLVKKLPKKYLGDDSPISNEEMSELLKKFFWYTVAACWVHELIYIGSQ